MVFRFKCYNLPFSGGVMVMWTNTHCFDFFHVICLKLLSIASFRPLAVYKADIKCRYDTLNVFS